MKISVFQWIVVATVKLDAKNIFVKHDIWEPVKMICHVELEDIIAYSRRYTDRYYWTESQMKL